LGANCYAAQQEGFNRLKVDLGATIIDVAFLFLPGATGGGWGYRFALAGGGELALRGALNLARVGQAVLKGVQAGTHMTRPGSNRGGSISQPAPSSPVDKHHLLPQQFKSEFERVGLNIEDYKVELPRDFHKDIHGRGGGEAWTNSWNQQWKRFFRGNPNPTATEILRRLETMKKEFGIP
jgi:hypothetical protein